MSSRFDGHHRSVVLAVLHSVRGEHDDQQHANNDDDRIDRSAKPNGNEEKFVDFLSKTFFQSPAAKTIAPTVSSTTSVPTLGTSPNIFVSSVTSPSKEFVEKKSFPISGAVGIVLSFIGIAALATKLVELLLPTKRKPRATPAENEENLIEEKTQYRVATRTRPYEVTADESQGLSLQLVEIEC